MANRPIKLTWEAVRNGRCGRYRKMVRGRRFSSSVYDGDSRRNRSAAWAEFLEWEGANAVEDHSARPNEETWEDRNYRQAIEKFEAIHRLFKLTGHKELAAKWAQKKEQAEDPDLRFLAQLNLDFETLDEFATDAKTALERADHANVELSAGKVVETYLADLQARVDTGQRSAGLYGQTRSALKHFVAWFGESSGMDTISEGHVQEYHAHMIGKIGQLKQTTVADYTKIWRTFLQEVAADYPEIRVPENIRSRRYVVRPGNIEVSVFDADEVLMFVELGSPRMELYLLLMLNCGMTQRDIADVRAENVDWAAGRIVRRRSKEANAPTINWLLWDRTAELLREFGQRSTPVLTKVDGGPLVVDGVHSDGRPYRRDAIVSNWRHLVDKARRHGRVKKDWHKTLKQLRKTASTKIEAGPHAEFVDMFLDHSRVARRHYLKGQVVPKFDQAIVWLGEQFGFATTKGRIGSSS